MPGGGAGTEPERRSQAKDDAVCVWYAHGVCGYAFGVRGCGCAGVGHRQRDTVRQRITCAVCGRGVCAGWISRIICLCFLSSFITSVIKTTPMKCESATLTSATS